MGNPFIHEWAVIKYVEFGGAERSHAVDISGPTVEATKLLDWAAQVIRKDGGKVTDVVFGTRINGVFREQQKRRRIPLIQGGYRIMSSHLRR